MNFEIVIIGASTAGLYAAEQLASAGKNVALFESQATLNPNRRTYIITSGLERVLGDIPQSLILHRISTVVVDGPSTETEITLREPDLILERNQLTIHLASMAQDSGVELFFGHTFDEYKYQEGRTILQFKTKKGNEKQVKAKTLICADGATSTGASKAGIPLPVTVPLLQAEVSLPSDWDHSVTKVWFDTHQNRYFYWLIPESEQKAVVGMIGEDHKPVRTLLDNFLSDHNLKAVKYQSGRAAMHHPRLRPWGETGNLPIYLIGDAAGQVKVTTVGGTVTGFWGAKAAVRSILNETSYRSELRSLKSELDIHWYIRSLLECLDNPGFDELVEIITPAVRNFLASYDRDQMAKNFWKLFFIQPRFITLGLKLLLREPEYTPLPPTKSMYSTCNSMDMLKKSSLE